MKQFIVITLVVFFAIAGTAFASPSFGLKLGMNLANIVEDPAPSPSPAIRPGVDFGAMAEMSLTPSNKTLIRAELSYVMKGAKLSGNGVYSGVPYSFKSTMKVDELVLAPFVEFRFPSGSVTPFIEAGPELGFNLTHKASTDVTVAGQTTSSDDDLSNWGSTNFGLNFGAGVAVPAGTGEVTFDARYNLGLSNMYTGTGGGSDKTNGILFLIGYNFSVAK